MDTQSEPEGAPLTPSRSPFLDQIVQLEHTYPHMTYVGGGTADDYTFVDDSELDLEHWDALGLGLFDSNYVPSVVSP